MKSREHLAAVKSVGTMLTLQTMRFAHEIVDASSLTLPSKSEISKKEMDLANTLIDSMSDKFDPNRYKDDYYEKVMELIRMKIAGVAPEAPAAKGPGPAKVVDLMEVLKQSLNETKKAKGSRAPAVEEETTLAVQDRSKPGRSRKAR
jgi:DNA end-binding protein Ku